MKTINGKTGQNPAVSRSSMLHPRIAARTERESGRNACWVWSGARTRAGYGALRIGGKVVSAHRLSYAHSKGPIPAGMFVRHKCDNPSCVRPSHLELGTPQDNASDMVIRGRQCKRQPRVAAALNAKRVALRKLTEDQARRAYARVKKGEHPKSVAKDMGVHTDTIRCIAKGDTWSHVTGETCRRHTWRNK